MATETRLLISTAATQISNAKASVMNSREMIERSKWLIKDSKVAKKRKVLETAWTLFYRNEAMTVEG